MVTSYGTTGKAASSTAARCASPRPSNPSSRPHAAREHVIYQLTMHTPVRYSRLIAVSYACNFLQGASTLKDSCRPQPGHTCYNQRTKKVASNYVGQQLWLSGSHRNHFCCWLLQQCCDWPWNTGRQTSVLQPRTASYNPGPMQTHWAVLANPHWQKDVPSKQRAEAKGSNIEADLRCPGAR